MSSFLLSSTAEPYVLVYAPPVSGASTQMVAGAKVSSSISPLAALGAFPSLFARPRPLMRIVPLWVLLRSSLPP
jgi:hypothetical protein